MSPIMDARAGWRRKYCSEYARGRSHSSGHCSGWWSAVFLPWLILLAASSNLHVLVKATDYANVTLRSLNDDLEVVVYLPQGLRKSDNNERAFYYSSRFDHSSMIGSVTRRVKRADGHHAETHTLYGTDLWRMPHNTHWPESGVGLASEFGVGDDGAFCLYLCGWSGAGDITNGVLGYSEAKNGESYLKIGVGELLKGTCPRCDSTEDYRFNSPYLFAKPPEWRMSTDGKSNVRLEHQATLKQFGYRLVKDIRLERNILTVTTSLTNLGTDAFSTVWYSHNFFTCDDDAVGPGYSLDLQLKGIGRDVTYQEPGTWSWSTPLADYARITNLEDRIHIDMVRALDPGIRIKTEFVNDGVTQGAFTIYACGTAIHTSFPQLEEGGPDQAGFSMYAYNLYIERGTFSPEPQILLDFLPGETKTWTQRVAFDDWPPVTEYPAADARPAAALTTAVASLSSVDHHHRRYNGAMLLLFVMTTLVMLGVAHELYLRSNCRRQRLRYQQISDSTVVTPHTIHSLSC